MERERAKYGASNGKIWDIIANDKKAKEMAWELDVKESTFNPGPGWRQQTCYYTYSSDGKYLKMIATGMREDGTPILYQFAAAYDGKEYPVFGNPKVDWISLQRVDKYIVITKTMRDGMVTQTGRMEVSKDEKTMHIETKGTDERGVVFNNRLTLRRKWATTLTSFKISMRILQRTFSCRAFHSSFVI